MSDYFEDDIFENESVEAQKREDERKLEVLDSVFSTTAGKEALKIICTFYCREHVNSFNNDPLVMAANCGMRNVALLLKEDLRKYRLRKTNE